MGGNEIKYIQNALDTNWVSQYGSNIDEFEKELERYLGERSYVTALSSGTSAIHLGLKLLGVEEHDYVICQSFTFVASANPILYLKAIPVFVDSEKDTWNMCPDALENAIKFCLKKGKKPKAIIAVSLYGMPFKVNEIMALSRMYEIPVLEDSAEALGSKYKGQPCGTFGDLSVISFNGNKIITTSGGGILISKNQNHKDRALFLATQAKDNQEYYAHTEIGYNYRMSNISAGIGRGQMEVLELRIKQKRENHDFYRSIIDDLEDVSLLSEPNADFFSNFWLNTITLDPKSKLTKEDFKKSFSDKNIETRYLWKPMHLQPLYEKYHFFGNNLCGTLFENGLCLPSGTSLTESCREVIKSVFKIILN